MGLMGIFLVLQYLLELYANFVFILFFLHLAEALIVSFASCASSTNKYYGTRCQESPIVRILNLFILKHEESGKEPEISKSSTETDDRSGLGRGFKE